MLSLKAKKLYLVLLFAVLALQFIRNKSNLIISIRYEVIKEMELKIIDKFSLYKKSLHSIYKRTTYLWFVLAFSSVIKWKEEYIIKL